MKSTIFIISIVCALLIFSLGATKKPVKKDTKPVPPKTRNLALDLISMEFDTLPFEKDDAALFAYLDTLLSERILPQMQSATDEESKDKIRQQKEKQLEAIKATKTEFNNEKTGYEISIIGSEFTHGNGEYMYTFDDSGIQKYYFFINNKLWKLVCVYSDPKPFDQYLKELKGNLGEPDKMLEDDFGKTVGAVWTDNKRIVRAHDHSQLYKSRTFMVGDRGLFEQIADLRGGKKPEKDEMGEIDDIVEKIQKENKGDQIDNIVDELTGTKQGPVDYNVVKDKKKPEKKTEQKPVEEEKVKKLKPEEFDDFYK
jgi:hypothetical protein